MKRPRKVVIGPFSYRIRWPKKLKDPNGEEVSGMAEHVDLIIRVSRDVHPDLQRKTLLHEIMHGCVWVTGHNADAVSEEHFVRATAFPLLQVLRDNPEVTRFLFRQRK